MFSYHWRNKRNFPGTPLLGTWFIGNFSLHICKKNYVVAMYNTTRSDLNQRKSQNRARTKVFENSFFMYCIKLWLKLGDEI